MTDNRLWISPATSFDSVATLVLLVAFDQQAPCNPADLNLALGLFVLSLLCGLWGMISALNGDFLASPLDYVPGKWSFTATRKSGWTRTRHCCASSSSSRKRIPATATGGSGRS